MLASCIAFNPGDRDYSKRIQYAAGKNLLPRIIINFVGIQSFVRQKEGKVGVFASVNIIQELRCQMNMSLASFLYMGG